MASTFAIQSPEDVLNASLGRIGYKKRVGSMLEGSLASRTALDIYSQTRDELLRSFEWGFAERDVLLTLQKVAPVTGYTPPLQWSSAYPILPWIYQYASPPDMLKLRALRPTPIIIPIFDPQPVTWRVANDNSYTPSQKVILTNLYQAVAVYTAQVTDPTVWEADFCESLIAALARRLAPSLSSLDVEKIEAADEAQETAGAETRLG